MNDQRLVLTALEAEVVEAALELYLQLRPGPADRRYEYRYRAARSVLDDLQRGGRGLRTPNVDTPARDEPDRSDDEMLPRRSSRDRIED